MARKRHSDEDILKLLREVEHGGLSKPEISPNVFLDVFEEPGPELRVSRRRVPTPSIRSDKRRRKP
jgi:hypothetical protein